MYNLKKLIHLFSKKPTRATPILIIKKDFGDSNVKEYQTIEDAIADLETDPCVSSDKIEKLKSSLKQLKNKTSIRIRNGEII